MSALPAVGPRPGQVPAEHSTHWPPARPLPVMTVRYKYIGLSPQFPPVHKLKKPSHIHKYRVNSPSATQFPQQTKQPNHHPPSTLSLHPTTLISTMATEVAKSSTCCGKGDTCVCAQQAKCSCGKQSALHCSCDKAAKENAVSGPRCSCRARPAGECTCDRASSENVKPNNSCACGSRPAGACTCEKAADGGYNPNEIDFTTKK